MCDVTADPNLKLTIHWAQIMCNDTVILETESTRPNVAKLTAQKKFSPLMKQAHQCHVTCTAQVDNMSLCRALTMKFTTFDLLEAEELVNCSNLTIGELNVCYYYGETKVTTRVL